MLTVNPYLNFNGETEQAFEFYRSVFGGQFTMISRFRDMPDSDSQVSESEKDRIMHIALPIGNGTILMGTDISEAQGMKIEMGNNMFISLNLDSEEEGRRLFEGLSEGGTIEMNYEKMFWGDYFASFRDKFGINWMINAQEK